LGLMEQNRNNTNLALIRITDLGLK
jgi:hypothetical protein